MHSLHKSPLNISSEVTRNTNRKLVSLCPVRNQIPKTKRLTVGFVWVRLLEFQNKKLCFCRVHVRRLPRSVRPLQCLEGNKTHWGGKSTTGEFIMPTTDDSRDLQKQIGCMNGIFQLFDHQHVVAHRQISFTNYKGQLLGIFWDSFIN